MFGYIKPYKDELKLKHIKEYQNYYCAICNGIKDNIGIGYSVFLNYEIVFLYLFLDGINKQSEKKDYSVSCMLNPFSKRKVQVDSDLLEYVSFVNMYLVLIKMNDNYRDDNNFFCRLLYLSMYHNMSKKKYWKNMKI